MRRAMVVAAVKPLSKLAVLDLGGVEHRRVD
jgi:hypothetical protein